jgi:NADH dehydrogenase [ubiquinone] 1 alpha subcomplex assembly factor 7
LQAVRAHKRHEVLDEPGSADLSALVDFASFGAMAEASGARVLGPVSQGDFLEALGIAARAVSLAKAGGKAEEISSAYHRLVDADKMGMLFKVMALADPKGPLPEGFAA